MYPDSNIKLILSKVKNIYSELNPDYYETNRVVMPDTNQSLLNYIIGLLEEFQQFVQHSFPTVWRQVQEYEKLQSVLQNKEAQIRNYIRVQQCMGIKEENLQQKIVGLERVIEQSRTEKENMKKQCDKLRKQLVVREPPESYRKVLHQQNQSIEKITSKYSIRKSDRSKSKLKRADKSSYQTQSSVAITKNPKMLFK